MIDKNIRSLQPLDTGEDIFQPSPTFVWASIFITFMATLLPWRNCPDFPDILLVVLAFWCVHSAKGVGLLEAFVLGLLMDVHDTNVLGRHALYYVLVIYAVIMIRQHIVQFSVLAHFVSILPVFVVAAIPGRIFEAWLAGVWSGWGGVWSGFITSLLWFVVDILFKFFSHGHHDEQKLN